MFENINDYWKEYELHSCHVHVHCVMYWVPGTFLQMLHAGPLTELVIHIRVVFRGEVINNSASFVGLRLRRLTLSHTTWNMKRDTEEHRQFGELYNQSIDFDLRLIDWLIVWLMR